MISGGLEEDPRGGARFEDSPGYVSPKFLQLALIVLQQVPNAEQGLARSSLDKGIHPRWTFPILSKILDSFYDPMGFGKYLQGDRSVALLEEMAQILCKNTAKPVIDHLSPDDWVGQFAGPNLRWESLGDYMITGMILCTWRI